MNTIVLLMDTLRRDHLGCYGASPVKTPHLDRLAGESMVFENSYISSYPCMPARQDLWTGKLSFLRRGWAPLEYDECDVVTRLREHGVNTALVTDHYHYWQYGSGNYHQSFHCAQLIRGQENDNYRWGDRDNVDYPAGREKLSPSWPRYSFNTRGRKDEAEYFTAQVFDSSIEWLRENRSASPFFLTIDCFDPHEPFDPPPAYALPYLPDGWEELIKWPVYGESSRYTEKELAVIHGLYCGEIAFLDHCFGKLWAELERLSLLDDTAILVTSDHGWLFGEHGWLGKHAHTLYNDIARTPLLLHKKGLRGRSDILVQMADLMPTILDLMGAPIPDGVQGKSLAPLWDEAKRREDDILHREHLLFGVYGGEAYCTDGRCALVKAPNETNTPLYWYTHSHFNNWDFGQVNYWRDSVKRLEQFDGERFPVQYRGAYPRHAAPEYAEGSAIGTRVERDDALYDLVSDPGQLRNLAQIEPEKLTAMKAAMARLLRDYEAPLEQFTRLGLDNGIT